MIVKEDRSIVMYILLSLVTCGIYSYWFLYTMAQDANVVCLVQFILLSFVTCGIYGWFWYYSLANRLAENAPRYGMTFTENGTTVLMWLIVGALLCGIGPFIAMNILITNMNRLAHAYNVYASNPNNQHA